MAFAWACVVATHRQVRWAARHHSNLSPAGKIAQSNTSFPSMIMDLQLLVSIKGCV